MVKGETERNRIAYIDVADLFEINGKPFRQLSNRLNRKNGELYKDINPFFYREVCARDISELASYHPSLIVFNPEQIKVAEMEQIFKGTKYVAYTSEREEYVREANLYGARVALKKGN